MFLQKLKQSILVGFALFAMFFGGGNIIFPPYIGMLAGEDWISAFAGYVFAEVGLIFLVFAALMKSKNYEHIGSIFAKLGDRVSAIFMLILVLSVCLIVIPRTAIVSHDVLFKYNASSYKGLLIYSILYFFLSVIFAYRRSKLIDYIGKIFTPILLFCLGLLVISAIINPFGSTEVPSKIDSAYLEGLEAGYQTMGFLGMPFFCVLVMNMLDNKGFNTYEDKARIILYSSFLIIFLMLLVYCGLTYVGATAASSFTSSIAHTELLNIIFLKTFGPKVSILIYIAITVSCLSTAIALSSYMAVFISRVLNGKISYGVVLILQSCIFIILATLGIESLIKYASYIINIILPSVFIMTIFNFFESFIKNVNIARVTVLFVIIESFLEQLYLIGVKNLSFISFFPFYETGLAWISFAILGFIIGTFIPYKEKNISKNYA